ncbi:MAG: hypothetical protein Q9227_001146 [Pyrenula ochraceoflavens]
MSSEEVSRIFMPRKQPQRSNSSSSMSSTSSTSTVTSQPNSTNNPSTGEPSGWAGKKKGTRGIWPSSKAEAVSGVSNVRPQPVGPSSSGPAMSASLPASHQPSPVLPSQHALQSQANGGRAVNGNVVKEASAVLALLPLNGTFERKQINLPTWPEVLRVGRQTNAKTLPTPVNGFFDSKVLSRQHAEVWSDAEGRVYIKDVKSSNGTFVNGQRLSPENRESDPHQLREHDTLELGIDIVSEDQKTVVHHKVSAKVEFAGVLGSAGNVLDLNFGDIDPSTGASLISSPLSQGSGRGRPGNQFVHGKMSAPQGLVGSQILALQQGQMRGARLNVEDLVRLLATEMKQAKMSNQTLTHTNDFLQSVLSPSLEKDKDKQPQSANDSNSSRQSSGRLKMPKVDPISRFSDPPAPPPQQPLPEKPDASRSSPQDVAATHSLLKRADTEKPKTGSPTSPQSSQILSLVEALGLAKKEIDSQSARVKQLEDLLQQERTARESAEEKARSLESHGSSLPSQIQASSEPQPSGLQDDRPSETSQAAAEPSLIEQPSPWNEVNGSVSERSLEKDAGSASLQQRIDTMMAEIDEMKQQMERYRSRAESAETEASSSRASLAEMVAKLRQEGPASTREAIELAATVAEASSQKSPKSPASESMSGSTAVESEGARSPTSHSQGGKHLENAVTAILRDEHQSQGNSIAAQSAPYASMIGVVLIGVGLMAYLNSLQKGER